MHSKLYVHDEEFQEDGKNLQQRTQMAEEVLGDMLAILGQISEDAISEGNTAANYARLKETIQLLRNKFTSLGAKFKQITDGFIQEVDAADEDLY